MKDLSIGRTSESWKSKKNGGVAAAAPRHSGAATAYAQRGRDTCVVATALCRRVRSIPRAVRALLSSPDSICVHSRDSRALLRASGFSILELLVAMAVLAMLVVMVAQLVLSGSAVIAGSRKNLGADAQAREVFSRFSLDVAQMVKRPDMDAVFSDQAGNKKMYFISESPGFASSTTNLSTLSLVGYRVGTNAGLERLGKGLPWSGAGSATFLTYTSPATTNAVPESTLPGAWSTAVGVAPVYDGSDADYHPLADGVFRIEYCFLKKDGTYSLVRDPSRGFRDVAAIVLSLAVLDGDSRKIATVSTNLAAALPGPTAANLAANILPAELWQGIINNSATFATAAGIPQPAASRVRIYQRAIPLNTP